MFSRMRVTHNIIFLKQCTPYKINQQKRNVQVSVIGAAGDLGSNVALLLKQNWKIQHLQLYDDEEKIHGIGMELAHVPGGPTVMTYTGGTYLGTSVRGSDIILMTSRASRKPGNTREEMMAANAAAVQYVCRAMIEHNPDAFLAISTNPINCIIPFASALLYKFNCYNPYKIFGITHIDTARSRSFAGNALQVNPRHLQVPVIGGHSDETIIPLFSNLTPSHHSIEPCQADTLTRLVRKAGTEVVYQKQGRESATLAMAWSISEFVDGLVDAVCGGQVVLNCYTANPHFGTRFFAGPTSVGYYGIVQACCDFPMSDYESYLLNSAVPIINRDVSNGEEYVKYIATLGK